jgi:hypothetical protein
MVTRADSKKATPLRSGPRSFSLSGNAVNLRRSSPPSSRRDLASVGRVLLGGDLINAARSGDRIGTVFRCAVGTGWVQIFMSCNRPSPAKQEVPDFIDVLC